jgi:hypothetical protein
MITFRSQNGQDLGFRAIGNGPKRIDYTELFAFNPLGLLYANALELGSGTAVAQKMKGLHKRMLSYVNYMLQLYKLCPKIGEVPKNIAYVRNVSLSLRGLHAPVPGSESVM